MPEQDPCDLAPGSLDPATGYELPKPLSAGLSRSGSACRRAMT